MRQEITLEELQTDYDWAEVFGEGTGGNCTQDLDSLDGTSLETCLRRDVAEVIAAVNGANEYDDWVGVFRMRDGRFLAAVGGCDYTGWDCQASNTLTVAATLESLITSGLTPEQCRRLEIEHPASNRAVV